MTSFPNILVRISLISEKIVLMCNDFLLWWLVETRLILQEGLLELLLVLGTLAPIEVDVLTTWSPPISFILSICGFWNCHQIGRDHLLRVELYVVEFWRVYFCPPAQGLLPEEFLSKLLSPRSRRIRRVFRVILCSRIGGISTGQKQKLSDIHSNEPSKVLWLNWFVEAPFLGYFPQIVAIHHGIHPPSSGQLQQLRKGSFLYSAYRYSAIPNLFERRGVDVDFSIIPGSTSQIYAKFHVGLEKFSFITELSTAKFCPTIGYRWLFPDSQVSSKTLCSAVIDSHKFCCSRYGFTCASPAQRAK